MQQVLNYLTTTAFDFKNTALYASPLKLVQQASGLAASLYTTLNLIPEGEKESLLGYYAQWTGIQPIEFLESLSEMVDLHYHHGDLIKSVLPAQRFVRVVSMLWEKLGTLKFMGENERSLVLGIEKGFKNRRTSTSDILD